MIIQYCERIRETIDRYKSTCIYIYILAHPWAFVGSRNPASAAPRWRLGRTRRAHRCTHTHTHTHTERERERETRSWVKPAVLLLLLHARGLGVLAALDALHPQRQHRRRFAHLQPRTLVKIDFQPKHWTMLGIGRDRP